jgi:hypothetical protein
VFGRVVEKKIYVFILVLCTSLPFLLGMDVTVMGRKRPLLYVAPLQGELELRVQRNTSNQKGQTTERSSKLTVFNEKLRLRTTGDIYHPSLLSFNIGMGFGLMQEKMSSDEESSKTNRSLDEYNISIDILRAKPVSTSLYANKTENLIPRQFAGPLRNENEQKGFSLSIRSKQWPMRIQYSIEDSMQDSLSSAATSRDFFRQKTTRFQYWVGHDFSENSRMSIDFDRYENEYVTTGPASTTQRDNLRIRHDLTFGSREQYHLGSNVSIFSQTGQSSSESFSWNEKFKIEHSDTFSTFYNFRYQDIERGTSKSERTYSQAGFKHKLYKSLSTRGSISVLNNKFGGRGDSQRRSGNLNFSYTKNNRWGVLNASYGVDMATYEQKGSGTVGTDIKKETVPASARVLLDRVNIIRSSIVVKDTGGVPFDEINDYDVEAVGDRWRIVFFMPPFAVGDEVFIEYDYRIVPEKEENTLQQNFNLRQKFTNGVSLYFIHRRQDEEVSSTTEEIRPDEYRSNTYGSDYTNNNLSLMAEYNKLDSTSIPTTSKLLSGTYRWLRGSKFNADFYASNEWFSFGAPDLREVEIFRTGATIISNLTDRHTITTDLNYRNEKDSKSGATKGFQIGSGLRYNYRDFRLATGLKYNFLKRKNSENKGSFWYISAKRLF